MMRFGIPKYRLPRDVLDGEVQRILDMGVELELNCKVTNILDAINEGGFDAAFLAVGAHIGKRAYIPAGSSARILDAVSFLRSMEARTGRSWAGASLSTAAATPRWTSHARPSASAPRRQSLSIAARAKKCRRTIPSSKKPCRKVCS